MKTSKSQSPPPPPESGEPAAVEPKGKRPWTKPRFLAIVDGRLDDTQNGPTLDSDEVESGVYRPS